MEIGEDGQAESCVDCPVAMAKARSNVTSPSVTGTTYTDADTVTSVGGSASTTPDMVQDQTATTQA